MTLLMADEIEENVLQKLVVLSGPHSTLQVGDPDKKPGENQVLPKLLKEGWVIKEISSNGESGGYALIEKKISAREAALLKSLEKPKEVPYTINIDKGGNITLAGVSTSTHNLSQKLKDMNATSASLIKLKIHPQCSHDVVTAVLEALKAGDYNKVSFGDQK